MLDQAAVSGLLHLSTLLLIDCGVLAQRWQTLAPAVLVCIAMLRCPAMLPVPFGTGVAVGVRCLSVPTSMA